MTADSDRIVSFDSEELILVDGEDRETGYTTKAAAHAGAGILHRAFSIFIFNTKGDVLVQQRAAGKLLWPGFWSNSCCSHPRRGEDMASAVTRRLREELGLDCALRFVYKFQYHAPFGDAGSERELCWVYVGTSDGTVQVNATEIAAWRYLPCDELDREMAATPERFTPWMKLEWARLRGEFSEPRSVAPDVRRA